MVVKLKNELFYQELYFKKRKNIIKTSVDPLYCYICKKELNGISITAKIIDGKSVFLCSHHYQAKPDQILLR